MPLDLKKKVGPFPMWVWVAGGVAVLAYLYFRHQQGQTDSGADDHAGGGGGGRGGFSGRRTPRGGDGGGGSGGGKKEKCAPGTKRDPATGQCVERGKKGGGGGGGGGDGPPPCQGKDCSGDGDCGPNCRCGSDNKCVHKQKAGGKRKNAQGIAYNGQGTGALAPGPGVAAPAHYTQDAPVMMPAAQTGSPATGGPFGAIPESNAWTRFGGREGTYAEGHGGGVATGSDHRDSSGDDCADIPDPDGKIRHVCPKFGHWVQFSNGNWTWDPNPGGSTPAAGGGVSVNSYFTPVHPPTTTAAQTSATTPGAPPVAEQVSTQQLDTAQRAGAAVPLR